MLQMYAVLKKPGMDISVKRLTPFFKKGVNLVEQGANSILA